MKDNHFTKGVRTCGASRLMLDQVPDFSATTIERLTRAGVVLLGKLNTWPSYRSRYGIGRGEPGWLLCRRKAPTMEGAAVRETERWSVQPTTQFWPGSLRPPAWNLKLGRTWQAENIAISTTC